MARKKSKGSKKSRSKKARTSKSAAPSAEESGENAAVADQPVGRGSGASSTGSAPEVDMSGYPEPSEEEAEVIDLDDEAADLDTLVAAAAGEEELISIDLDEEIEDAQARQRLIEEALAFVAAEESTDAPAAAIEADGTAEGDSQPHQAGDAPTPMDGEEEERDAPGDRQAPPSASPDQPLIGAEALLALSDIRAEGLASLPGELVLDLGDALTPEERDRLLSSALAHAEMQEAIYRIPVEERRSRRIKSAIAAAILLIAAFLAVNPPGLIVPTPPPALSESDRERGVLVALTLQAQKVEAFQVTNGRLPRSIAEVEESVPDIRLVRSSNRLYQLIAYGADGEPVVYDSSVPAPDFERLWRTWSTTADDNFGGLR